MTTYLTGNPVGSADPRDLYDNAQVIDDYANSEAETTNDRLGVERATIAGIDAAARSAIAQAGYEFIGDYAAGIELTAYNQVVRDTSGEFWRVSGSTALPYTTTGAGLPEGGAFVTVGDAALRQELQAPDSFLQDVNNARGFAQSVDSVSTLRTSTFPASLERLWLSGYYGVGTAGGGPLYRDSEDTATADNGGTVFVDGEGVRWKAGSGFVLAEDVDVKIPVDFDTLQGAVDDLSSLSVLQGKKINLIVESGHQVSSGIIVYDGDYRHFFLSAEDAFLECSNEFAGTLITGYRASAPTLATNVDMRNYGDVCYQLGGAEILGGSSPSDGQILPGVEIRNAGSAIQTWQGSRMAANNVILRDCGNRTIHCTHGSFVSFRQGEIHGSSGDALYVSHSSTVNARDVTITGTSGGSAIYVRASSIVSCEGGPSISNTTGDAVITIRGASLFSWDNGTIDNYSGVGVRVDEAGVASIKGGAIIDGAGSDDQAVLVTRGGKVSLEDGVIVRNAGRNSIRCTGGGYVSCTSGVILTDPSSLESDLSIASGGIISIGTGSTYGTASTAVNTLSSAGIIFDAT